MLTTVVISIALSSIVMLIVQSYEKKPVEKIATALDIMEAALKKIAGLDSSKVDNYEHGYHQCRDIARESLSKSEAIKNELFDGANTEKDGERGIW